MWSQKKIDALTKSFARYRAILESRAPSLALYVLECLCTGYFANMEPQTEEFQTGEIGLVQVFPKIEADISHLISFPGSQRSRIIAGIPSAFWKVSSPFVPALNVPNHLSSGIQTKGECQMYIGIKRKTPTSSSNIITQHKRTRHTWLFLRNNNEWEPFGKLRLSSELISYLTTGSGSKDDELLEWVRAKKAFWKGEEVKSMYNFIK